MTATTEPGHAVSPRAIPRTITALATLLAALALTACTNSAPPPPPEPETLRPDGTLVVTNPRNTTGVDPCALIPPDEIRDIFGGTRAFSSPLPPTRPLDPDHACLFSGDDGILYLYLDENSLGEPPPPELVGRAGVPPSTRPTTLIAGNAATIGSGDQQRCGITIALDPRPATSSITLSSDYTITCDELRGIAERIVNRLPPVP